MRIHSFSVDLDRCKGYGDEERNGGNESKDTDNGEKESDMRISLCSMVVLLWIK